MLSIIVCSTRFHPRVDLRELELPEPSNLVGRKPLSIDPSVDGVLGHPEMGGYFLY